MASATSAAMATATAAAAAAMPGGPAPVAVLQQRYRYGNITIAPPDGWTGHVRPDGAPLAFDQFVRQQFIINNVCVAALTLYIWEFVASIPQEIALYRRRAWSSPHVLLFALVRYATVPAVVLPAYSIFHDFTAGSDNCLRHQQLSIVPVQFAVALVFSWRACAIWGFNRRVVWALAVLIALQTGGSFALLWFSVDELMANGSCMPVAYHTAAGRVINTLPYFYLLAMLMDLATVGLSLWRLLEISNDGRPMDTQIHFRDVGKPIRLVHKLKVQYRSLTPIVEQLVASGLSYLAIATAFNLLNFVLEITEVYYAKALIPLYAPLMAILGQRIVLLEARTVYADRSGSGSRGRSLVERVLRDGRRSWEGSDLNLSAVTEKRPESGNSPAVAPAPVSPATLASGGGNKELGLADFLGTQPTDEDARDPNNTSPLYRLRHFRGRGSALSSEIERPAAAAASPERSASPIRQPRRASASAAPPTLSPEARALALRMAGMEQTPSAPLRALDPHAGGDSGVTHAAKPIAMPPELDGSDATPTAPSG